MAHRHEFLGGFLDFVKEKQLKLDFISVHNYGTSPEMLNDNTRPYSTKSILKKQDAYFETVCAHGFGDIPMIVDEWGMATAGFYNREECPALMARETEVFSAYFVKLIYDLIKSDLKMEQLMICLSGQHEMTEDFSGFRNFFTLNFIKKPIYNAFILASRLGKDLLAAKTEDKNVFVIPTKNQNGEYAVLISYASENFDNDLPEKEEVVCFAENIKDKTVTVFCIDQCTTNPYRLYQKKGMDIPTEEDLKLLREEGNLKPVKLPKGTDQLRLRLTSNAVYLITVTE